MKYLALILLLPSISFASEKDAICDLAFTAHIYQIATVNFPMNARSALDDIEPNDPNGPVETLAPKEFALYHKCSKLNSDTGMCEDAEEKLEDKLTLISRNFYNGNLPSLLCNSESFDDVNHFLGYQLRLTKECKKSKDPLAFIADQFDIPTKHLKSSQELKSEINERYKISGTSKHCDVSPLVYSNELDLKNSNMINCKKMIPRVNLILKLQKKCSKDEL